MVFEQYDRVRIINLAHRTDRRREMQAEIAKIGLGGHPDLAFFSAIHSMQMEPFHSKGARGCFLSHLQVLEQALADRTSVMVLEDDCTFLPLATEFEQAADTDILYGGWGRASNPDDLENSNLNGAHCMGFSLEALEKLVPFLQKMLEPAARFDPAIVRSAFDPEVRPPVDGAYIWFRRYHPEFKTEFAMIANQRASTSDIADRRWFDRTLVVKDFVALTRRVRNRLG